MFSKQFKGWLRGVAASAGLMSLFVAAAPAGAPAAGPTPDAGDSPDAVTEHVLVVSIDGLRPDAIDAYDTRTLDRLIREGASSMQAQTILPSKTLPSHTSMLTGVKPETHGVTWNSDKTGERGVVEVPTVFGMAKRAGHHTAAFFSKSKFHHLERPGTLDHTQAPNGPGHAMATRTVSDAITYLEHERPNMMFVHIGEPDYAGHTLGWMSFLYGMAVERADGAVGELLEAADDSFGRGNYTVIVTADHGGHGRNHGSADPRDMTIPWIAWGEGVADAGQRLGPGIRTMDTAATALWLLGVPVEERLDGTPVTRAFTPAPRTTTAAGPRDATERAAAPIRAR